MEPKAETGVEVGVATTDLEPGTVTWPVPPSTPPAAAARAASRAACSCLLGRPLFPYLTHRNKTHIQYI